jgi:hypothetical protein
MAIKPGNSPIKQEAWQTLSKGKTYGKYLDEGDSEMWRTKYNESFMENKIFT